MSRTPGGHLKPEPTYYNSVTERVVGRIVSAGFHTAVECLGDSAERHCHGAVNAERIAPGIDTVENALNALLLIYANRDGIANEDRRQHRRVAREPTELLWHLHCA